MTISKLLDPIEEEEIAQPKMVEYDNLEAVKEAQWRCST